jgi:NAD(P)-dependent dehydrogenase (short-subunit alcohol dehydrogenase family)
MTTDAIFITGASTGIGRAVAIYFAERGWRAYAGVRREADAESLTQEHAAIVPVLLDVTDAAQIAAAAARVAAEQGGRGLRALVNNAGVAVPAPIELIPLDELRRQFEINVIGVIAVTQALMPSLRAYGRGATIVNVSSVSARLSSPLTGAYSASKMALEGLTGSLRIELRPWGIRVVSVQPGPISTPIWTKTLADSEKILAQIPPERLRAYQPIIDVVKARVAQDPNFPAERVARVVWEAVMSPDPAARYLVTKRRLQRHLMEMLPAKWREALIARLLPKWGIESVF